MKVLSIQLMKKLKILRIQLNEIQEQSIQIRERKASSGATIEGLRKRKNDLVDRINSELNLTEENILENSNLFGIEESSRCSKSRRFIR